jgi:hypothetical protein
MDDDDKIILEEKIRKKTAAYSHKKKRMKHTDNFQHLQRPPPQTANTKKKKETRGGVSRPSTFLFVSHPQCEPLPRLFPVQCTKYKGFLPPMMEHFNQGKRRISKARGGGLR